VDRYPAHASSRASSDASKPLRTLANSDHALDPHEETAATSACVRARIPVAELITRRSQVRILPPLLKRRPHGRRRPSFLVHQRRGRRRALPKPLLKRPGKGGPPDARAFSRAIPRDSALARPHTEGSAENGVNRQQDLSGLCGMPVFAAEQIIQVDSLFQNCIEIPTVHEDHRGALT
jgi:hypothetical protein